MGNLYDEFIDAKGLIDKQLVFPDKPVDSKWVGIFGQMEMNFCKSKNLLLQVSKFLSSPCSDIFVGKILSLLSSDETDTRNQCHVGVTRAEPQIGVTFTFDCSVSPLHKGKEGCPKVCRKFTKVLETGTERIKLFFYVGQKYVIFY